MPARNERTITKFGGSSAVMLPPAWMRMFRLKTGDKIDVFYNSIVIIKPKGFQIDVNFLKKEFALIMELESLGKEDK